MTVIRPAVCERSRAYVSQGLDGELPELERRMLAAHLPRCGACRAYAHEAQAITAALRAAALEPLERPVAPFVPRRHPGRVRQVAAVAATALVVVGVGSVVDDSREIRERQRTAASWPAPTVYLSDRALREEQAMIALTPAAPPPLKRF